MSLLLIDGCEHGTPALKGWSAAFGTQPLGRTGSKSYGTNVQAVDSWQVASADEHATMLIGSAVMVNGNGIVGLVLRSDSGATSHVAATLSYVDGYVRIYRGDFNGTLLATSAVPVSIAASAWHYMELKATLSDTVGTVDVHIDGASVVTFSGDTKNAGTKTVFDTVALRIVTAGVTTYFDDIYVCNGAGTDHNDFFGDCSVATLVPTATNSPTWVGSDGNSVNNELLIDELPFADADYVGSATVGAIDNYTMGDVPAGSTIKGVAATIRAFKSDAGARTLRARIKSGTANVQKDLVLATSAAYLNMIAALDPATSAAWTEAAINAATTEVEVV